MPRANHEEADTRVVLHCIHAETEDVVVAARDTDILLLLIAFFSSMKCKQLWMKAGTPKQTKYFPVHEIRQKLSFPESVYSALLAFHAITGCDTVSYFSGHTKKTAWSVFVKEHLGYFSTSEKETSQRPRFTMRKSSSVSCTGLRTWQRQMKPECNCSTDVRRSRHSLPLHMPCVDTLKEPTIRPSSGDNPARLNLKSHHQPILVGK